MLTVASDVRRGRVRLSIVQGKTMESDFGVRNRPTAKSRPAKGKCAPDPRERSFCRTVLAVRPGWRRWQSTGAAFISANSGRDQSACMERHTKKDHARCRVDKVVWRVTDNVPGPHPPAQEKSESEGRARFCHGGESPVKWHFEKETSRPVHVQLNLKRTKDDPSMYGPVPTSGRPKYRLGSSRRGSNRMDSARCRQSLTVNGICIQPNTHI